MKNETNTEAQINVLGMAWNKLTGQNLTHRGVINPRTEAWQRYLAAGFTVHDLEFVILALKRKIREGSRNLGALRFSTLIEDTYHFEEEAALLRAEARNAKPPVTDKARVLQQTGRPTEPTGMRDARPVSELIADLKRAAGMKG